MGLLGLGGVELGPVSVAGDAGTGAIGLMYTKAAISAYTQAQSSEQSSRMKLGICLEPDSDIINYTPYVIPDNFVSAARIVTNLDDDERRQLHTY